MKDRLAQALSDQKPGGNQAWQAHLNAELPQTGVTLRAIVERRRIATSDLLRWRVGTTLPLSRRHDDPIELFCRDLLLLRARIAEKDGRIALHVEDRRLAEDWPIPA